MWAAAAHDLFLTAVGLDEPFVLSTMREYDASNDAGSLASGPPSPKPGVAPPSPMMGAMGGALSSPRLGRAAAPAAAASPRAPRYRYRVILWVKTVWLPTPHNLHICIYVSAYEGPSGRGCARARSSICWRWRQTRF
jgi:hypothetical protein